MAGQHDESGRVAEGQVRVAKGLNPHVGFQWLPTAVRGRSWVEICLAALGKSGR